MDRTKHRTILICALLGVAVLAAFSPLTRAGFTNFDDPEYVSENPHVMAGLTWANIKWGFITGHACNWHPLTWISHMLDAQIYGLNPFGHHLTNVALHLANSVLLFLLMKRLTGFMWRSAFVAGLFALHPLHVESVAWVSERKDVLSAFFGLLTIWTYARHVQATSPTGGKRPQRFYAASLLFFACGLMSKPMLVTLPFVLLLLDWWPLQRLRLATGELNEKALRVCLLEKLPFFGLALGSSLVTYLVQQQEGAMAPAGLTLGSRIGNSILSYIRYVEKVLWPAKLSVFYPHPATVRPQLADWITWEVPVALVLVLAVSILAIRWRSRRPYLGVGWFWYLGMLVPVIGLVQVGAQAMADRYMYLPAIGLFILITWAIAEALPYHEMEIKRSSKPRTKTGADFPSQITESAFANRQKVALGLASVAILVACGALTFRQAGFWRNNITLFSHALAVTENNATAHFNLGAALEQKGDLDQALIQYRLSLAADPFRPDARYNLGHALAAQGKKTEAEAEYRAALNLKPDYAFAHNNLGTVLYAQGRIEEARAHYVEAVRLKPDYAPGHCNLGKLLSDEGKYAEAADQFAQALQLDPNSVAAETGLGLALMVQNRVAESLPHFLHALALKPADLEANLNCGNAAYDAGDAEQARRCYTRVKDLQPEFVSKTLEEGQALAAAGQTVPALAKYLQAVRLAPEDAEAHQRLGLVLAGGGDLAGALTNFEQVVRHRPDSQAFYNLGLALVALGRAPEAIPHYRRAIELKPDFAAALNDLAWILATYPQTGLRDGKEAVRLAQRACQLGGEKEPRYWGTLDAAYAEAGSFEEAMATVEKTRDLAQAAGQKQIAEAAEQRLALYRLKQPFHQQ